MAESKKSKQYSRDINRFFKRTKMQYPTYAGYKPWSDGYKTGFAAGKAKGTQQIEEKFRG
jgi:hypothetical protein